MGAQTMGITHVWNRGPQTSIQPQVAIQARNIHMSFDHEMDRRHERGLSWQDKLRISTWPLWQQHHEGLLRKPNLENKLFSVSHILLLLRIGVIIWLGSLLVDRVHHPAVATLQ